jgi:N-acetylneuraminic acid mutarotase
VKCKKGDVLMSTIKENIDTIKKLLFTTPGIVLLDVWESIDGQRAYAVADCDQYVLNEVFEDFKKINKDSLDEQTLEDFSDYVNSKGHTMFLIERPLPNVEFKLY